LLVSELYDGAVICGGGEGDGLLTVEHSVQCSFINTDVETISWEGERTDIHRLPQNSWMLGAHGGDNYLGEIDGCLIVISELL